MRISTWLFLIGGAWVVIENVGNTPGSSLSDVVVNMGKVDAMLPGGLHLPDALPATGVYLLLAGAILRFGFSK